MNRTSDWLNCLFFTFAAIFIGIVGWGLIFFATSPLRKSQALSFPEKKELVATFSAQLEYNDDFLAIGGTLRGTPRPLQKGIIYHCLFDSFAVRNVQGHLLLAFQREPDKSYRYTVDPRLSPQKRQEIFDAFHIDTDDADYSADRSLLQQPFTLFLSPYGQIKEISLSPILRNALHDALVTTPADAIVKRALTSPEKLPPLLSKRSHKKQWNTRGEFFAPLIFHHTVTYTTDKKLTISSSSTTKKSPLTTNDWKLTWILNHATRMIDELHLDLSFASKRDFFNHHTAHRYHITADIELTFETKTEEIEL